MDHNLPAVSVVIPSYNHAAYIGEAVRSVLQQSLADLELIVVDDGSTDNSLEILHAFQDPRLQIIPQENRGAHAAINRGLHAARGEYLAVLNSDDAYHPQRLEKLLNLLKPDPLSMHPGTDHSAVSLAASYIEIIDSNGKTLGVKHGYKDCEPWLLPHPERSFRVGDSLHAALLTENYLATTSNYLFPRRLFTQVGDLLPLRYAHDWDFALRLAQAGRLALLPEPLLRYRVHAANTIRENQAAMIFEICWILAVHLPQHLGSQVLAAELSAPEQTTGLLDSLYTYHCEPVLVALLAHRLDADPASALRLLDPADPQRAVYLDYIRRQLAAEPEATKPPLASSPGLFHRLLRGLARRIRQI